MTTPQPDYIYWLGHLAQSVKNPTLYLLALWIKLCIGIISITLDTPFQVILEAPNTNTVYIVLEDSTIALFCNDAFSNISVGPVHKVTTLQDANNEMSVLPCCDWLMIYTFCTTC